MRGRRIGGEEDGGKRKGGGRERKEGMKYGKR